MTVLLTPELEALIQAKIASGPTWPGRPGSPPSRLRVPPARGMVPGPERTHRPIRSGTNGRQRPCPTGGEVTGTRAVTVETLERVLDAFNRHDLDANTVFFTEDAAFDAPRGTEPGGNSLPRPGEGP